MSSNTNNSADDSEISNTNLLEKDSGICNDHGDSEPEFKFETPEYSATGLRTHALWNFCKFTNGPRQPILEGLSIDAQEKIVMTELLYVLVGMRGTFIEPDDDEQAEDDFSLSFKISESVHPSLREMIENILPLASHYICIQKFVKDAQNDDAGAVLQALSSSLDDVIHDYYRIIAQLECNQNETGLSLHALHFVLRPTLQTVETVANLLVEIMQRNLRGSAVLTLLYNAMDLLLVDEHMQKFVGVLLKKAAVPYIRTLELWLEKGIIFDPSQEFLIEDLKQSDTNNLFDQKKNCENRYIIRMGRIPYFLKDLAVMILNTGQYLNVIFKCSKETKPKQIKLEFEPSKQEKFLQLINDAYRFSSRTLLKVISKNNDLMSHLWSLKHFLLLSKGDFIMKFLDTCDEELSKDYSAVSTLSVYNLIQMMLRVSSLHDDPHKDFLHCKFWPTDLYTQVRMVMNQNDISQLNISEDDDVRILNGYQSMAFVYVAPWPMTLIMNDFIIVKYQLIFRLLFYSKHVENELCKTWKLSRQISIEACALRHQLFSTVQNFSYYITADIIEPNWLIFFEKVKNSEDFDCFLRHHDAFVDEVLKNVLISHMLHLTDNMIRIFGICLEFCKVIQDELEHKTKVGVTTKIHNLGVHFRNALNSLLYDIRHISPPHQISTLANRINFNQFYSETLHLEEIKSESNDSSEASINDN